MKDRSTLTTELRNPRSADIDRLSALEIVDVINAEDALVAPAVAKQRRHVAAAVELIVEAFHHGGRLFYVGAGTSGRLGVLDAAECPPTFGAPLTQVQGIIAGGRRALVRSAEGAEDHAPDGAAAIDAKRVTSKDVVAGIAACGLTPFVRGALAHARKIGAATVFVTCAKQARRTAIADVVINPVVGPEVVTGSTRMKAGTATKLVLNTLTTAAMIRTGKVYGNLMVDLKCSCDKLRDRAVRIVTEITGVSRTEAQQLLADAEWQVKTAVVMDRLGLTARLARFELRKCGQSLRRVIEGHA